MSRATDVDRRRRCIAAMLLALAVAPLGCGGGGGAATATGGQAIIPPGEAEANEAHEAFMETQKSR